ncbi:hypothetical protein OHS33_17085 [Streptomyces sp. NBC_00536]|uniref:hypothetical protein n=1 Tax=Streptomyces sp. NBC_00536 TaxID=2975769 RepID=UPI002E80FA90|nr:hypothetical protein [Streptomyces sp. NBC_00536]WUC79898.1 hypothetical protein OHS33_17085 [Streptomyces sp. NBC_00536]
MPGTTRITVTLPTEQAEAVDRQIRNALLGQDLDRYEKEHGAFTEAEMAAAEAELRRGP